MFSLLKIFVEERHSEQRQKDRICKNIFAKRVTHFNMKISWYPEAKRIDMSLVNTLTLVKRLFFTIKNFQSIEKS